MKKLCSNESEKVLFEEVFGKGGKNQTGDLVKQNMVMKELLEKYPDGKITKGCKRGVGFALASVIKAEGFRKEEVETSQNQMWDFELFCCQMKN